MPTSLDTDWLPAGFRTRRIEANGNAFSVAIGGSGPTAVLLHGWPQTGRAWRHVMPDLAADFTVVVPDLRGAGESARPDSGYAKSNQARDMRLLLENLGLEPPVVVVGHDIGAMVAFAWATVFPDDVSALVLIDSLLPGVDLEQHMDAARGGAWHFGFFTTPEIPEMLLDGHESEFVATMFRQLSATDVFSDNDFEYYADAYRGRDRLRGGFEQYRALLDDGAELADLLRRRRLSMPVLDVVAAAGGNTAEGWGRLRDHADRLEVSESPTGHFVAEENPGWLIERLRQFVRAAS